MISIFKNYQQELMDLGKVVEKMIQEYYQHKGELKDYNNDFDNFLKDIIKVINQFYKIASRLNSLIGSQISPIESQLTTNLDSLFQFEETHVKHHSTSVQGKLYFLENSLNSNWWTG